MYYTVCCIVEPGQAPSVPKGVGPSGSPHGGHGGADEDEI